MSISEELLKFFWPRASKVLRLEFCNMSVMSRIETLSETFLNENPDLFFSLGLRLLMRALTLGMFSFSPLFSSFFSTELGQRCSSATSEQGNCFHGYIDHSGPYFAFSRHHYCCLISTRGYTSPHKHKSCQVSVLF